MRLVLSWLREFVDVKASAGEIAEKIGLRGFEVASIEPLDGGDAVIDFEITANRPNCVNLEIGQPMHAFDHAALAGAEIHVRRARKGETITTLDGVARTLDLEMLVIADRDRAQAVAGVMGGAASEVSARTGTVVFESAYFKPASVRRTSRRLGLKTEASTRFERGADIGAQAMAIQRAVALMEQIGAGRPSGPIVDCYPRPREPKSIHLRRERLALVL